MLKMNICEILVLLFLSPKAFKEQEVVQDLQVPVDQMLL